MTRPVVTVGPETPAAYAAEVMAGRGFAALPVVDDRDGLVGVVAEADVLRDRLPEDPRLHLRQVRVDRPPAGPTAPTRVGAVMTPAVRSVDAGADVADVARLFVDEGLRSVPVLEDGRLAGIVSRRDLLRALVRPDADLRDELLGLLEHYTGEPGAFEVVVVDGVATVRRVAGTPQPSAAAEARAVDELGRTVGGVTAVRVATGPAMPTGPEPTASTGGRR